VHISIFGGTGPAGQLLLEQALSSGHNVTAFARTPGKLPEHNRLTVVEGQLRDSEAITKAVQGSDAVLSLLGPSTAAADSPPLVEGYRNIVAAMKTHGVGRLVALGTASNADPTDRRELKISLAVKFIAKFQPVAYNTLVQIGQIVRNSGLQWTLVRVPMLTNGPRTERINVRTIGAKGGIRLSRANAAAYFLQQATDTTRIGQAPFITDK